MSERKTVVSEAGAYAPEGARQGWTPGPWIHYDDSASAVRRHQIAAHGKTIAHVYCTRGDEAHDDANARLISLAPEMAQFIADMDAILTGNAKGIRAVTSNEAWGLMATGKAILAKLEGK